MKINEWLSITVKFNAGKFSWMQKARDRIVCSDGFSMSVQASALHHCWPQRNGDECNNYETVEVGYPSEIEESLKPFVEKGNDVPYYDSTYDNVPVKVVDCIIEKHGGIYCEVKK